MNAIQEEAEKYALHYVKDFVPSVLRKETSFREHYERLEFNRLFFEGILYNNPNITREFSERRTAVYLQGLDEKALDEAVDKEELRFLKEIARAFRKHYSECYIEEVDRHLEDFEEEIRWANDDIRYHETRAYIQDKAFIGDVSEEERAECIEEGNEKVARFEEKRRRLLVVKKELEQLIAKS